MTTVKSSAKIASANETSKKNSKKFNPADLKVSADKLLKEYKTISQIKANKAEIVAKYQIEDDKSYLYLLNDAKRISRERVAEAAQNCKAAINYASVLEAAFGIVRKEKGFALLCNMAQSSTKGFTAAGFCESYFSYVSEDGTLLIPRSYVSADQQHILTYLQVKPLSATAAIQVLKISLKNFASSIKAGIKADTYDAIASRRYEINALVKVEKLNEDGSKGEKVVDVDVPFSETFISLADFRKMLNGKE